MKRRKAREAAVALLFQYDFNLDIDIDQLITDAREELELEFDDYSVKLVKGAVENIEKIDKLIAFSLQNWRFERISKTSKAMLRIALYEIIYEQLAAPVAIDEMLEIAKEYESNEASAFINGVLGKAIKLIEDGKV